MTYKQTLYKILPDHIKPKILKRNNRYKKWKYGYDQENDIVVISKSGQIGEIYEIQGLKIALPLEDKIYKRANKQKREKLSIFDKVRKQSEEATGLQGGLQQGVDSGSNQ